MKSWLTWIEKQGEDKRLVWLGAFWSITLNTLAYLSIFNAVQIALIAINTGAIKVSILVYCSLIFGALVLLWLFEWKIMIPAKVRFINWQQSKHEFPVMTKLVELQKQLDQIEQSIVMLKKKGGD